MQNDHQLFKMLLNNSVEGQKKLQHLYASHATNMKGRKR